MQYYDYDLSVAVKTINSSMWQNQNAHFYHGCPIVPLLSVEVLSNFHYLGKIWFRSFRFMFKSIC